MNVCKCHTKRPLASLDRAANTGAINVRIVVHTKSCKEHMRLKHTSTRHGSIEHRKNNHASDSFHTSHCEDEDST